MLEQYFQLRAHGTTVRTEIVAGFTTFLTMAYIMFVNPAILSDAGMDRGAVFVATCIGTAIGTLIMGLYANYPLALAPGMGLNAYFTYGVVKGMHYSWEVALGAVLISGVLFLILSLIKLREWIVDAIPSSLKMAISAGIGLFLGIIALRNAGIVTGSPDTLVTLGDVKAPSVILAVCGFLAIVALDAKRIPGAIIISVLAVTAIGIAIGLSPFGGIASAPPSLAPTFLQLDLKGALDAGLIAIIFAFFFVDLFDNTGTLVGVAHRAGLITKDGKIPRLSRVFIADSTATICGSLLGTTTVTSYIESAAGVRAGGRTGLVGGGCRNPLPLEPVLLAAGRLGRFLCHRPRPSLRRLPDDTRPRRDRLGGPDRICPSGHYGDCHAADLLDRHRHRVRLHRLRRREADGRQMGASQPCFGDSRAALSREICGPRVDLTFP